MTKLKEGDTLYFITDAWEIEEARVYDDVNLYGAWVIKPEDWEHRDFNIHSFHLDPNEFRPTRPEALHLLLQKLSERRKELMREASEVTDKIADVINEMYPE